MPELHVTSDVGRDLLQSAQVFRSEDKVIWEYVANSLQYVDPGVTPVVLVDIDQAKRCITITDNGRGMSRIDLQHFFQMHAENLDRRKGKIGRGLFGTGKSAAFGIASTLRVTTVRDGMRNTVKLDRETLEASKSATAIPVESIEQDVPTDADNGTTIGIERLHLRKIDRDSIIRFLEKKMRGYPRTFVVRVGGHTCEFSEPETAEVVSFEATHDEAKVLGDARLTLKVSKSPLEPDLRGIDIFSHGNWLSTTLAGSDGKEMAEYIFGECEIPALEEDTSPIKPFDNTRSGELNPNNPVVAATFRFVGPKIDQLRRKLVQQSREHARSREAQELARQARRMADVLTEDFSRFQQQLREARSIARGTAPGTKAYSPLGGDDDAGVLVEGGDVLAKAVRDSEGDRGKGGSGGTPPELPRPVLEDEQGTTTGKPSGGDGSRRSPRGGIDVQFKELGEDEYRAKYVSDDRVILINLDHPQLKHAYERAHRNVEEPEFIRLSWEVAVIEYAVALARMRDDAGHYASTDEPLFDIRDATDRLVREIEKAAGGS